MLDQFARDGYDAVIAGHTHGGQVCVPGVGALTTNCDLETPAPRGCTGTRPTPARRPRLLLAARLRGVGTSPYARIRVACRPEATLLTLVPRKR